MKTSDILLIAISLATISLFAFVPAAMEAYVSINAAHGFLASFIKFAILATLGECIALRITKGIYLRPGFGLAPRMLVWGIFGLIIKAAFVIFATGAPNLVAAFGLSEGVSLRSALFTDRMLAAFCVSTTMNCIFAPVMMVAHRVTDEHIIRKGGTIGGLFSRMDIAGILADMNWKIIWGFVFRKTIPLFWIPAHTITFLLPPDFRILFAALLSVALGIILAIASLRGQQ
ncbi:Mpv17/PMP22 family protein [Desulfovibrio mangrovi]|uniref:Mpv17/PMP22 family protein n=1 Tax=Desulfovibrio mangrovi TaxID=2976983 RepID=UPI002247B232|nr:Mpv17/PMP22 family protein [Desulfovibrio mangrovi]UZP69106.1 Mpv17/PMP22 family protein [Desulfovibrio mangrovi]